MTTADDKQLPGGPHDVAPVPPPAGSVHEPPRGAHFMNLMRWVLFGFLLVLALISVGSYLHTRLVPSRATASAGKVIYHCPMHPAYTSDRPGECPICGMTLVPAEAGGGGPSAGAKGATGSVPGLADVTVSPERVQLIGVRTATAERVPLGGRVELVGFVAPDETRLQRVQIRVAGWVRKLFVNETGQQVRAGQPLLAIYSPELLQSEQEYLIERGGGDSAQAAPDHAPLFDNSGAQRLRLLGVPDDEIRRLQREGRATTDLVLRSPVSGTVLERGVLEGQFVGADTPLLTVADLHRVWVMADVYEMDLARVRVGDGARFTADALPGRSFTGRIEFVYPTVSSDTRTLKARLALDNQDGLLRPGTYGKVTVLGHEAPVLAVPSEAVINTGERQYVFLARAGGRFEPREVTTGVSDGDRIAILHGLAPGDTVVASAPFLIDSESRLQAAIEGMGGSPGMAGMPGMDHPAGGKP